MAFIIQHFWKFIFYQQGLGTNSLDKCFKFSNFWILSLENLVFLSINQLILMYELIYFSCNNSPNAPNCSQLVLHILLSSSFPFGYMFIKYMICLPIYCKCMNSNSFATAQHSKILSCFPLVKVFLALTPNQIPNIFSLSLILFFKCVRVGWIILW